MKSSWMDVTTIMGWSRPAVGIIRTEAECAEYALNAIGESVDIRFCVFDASAGYREIDAGEVRLSLNRISGKSTSGPEVIFASGIGHAPSKASKAKKIVFRILDNFPKKIRAHLYLYLQRRQSAVREVIKAIRVLISAIKKLAKPTLSYVPVIQQDVTPDSVAISHPFEMGDTYISMGLDWDQKDLVALYKIKKLASLKVVLFCYDVIPVTHPHLCVGDVSAKFANYFSMVAWCADTILCISQCSKRDLTCLLEELGTPIPTMKVIRLGCQLVTPSKDPVSSELMNLKSQRYLLFVSTIERRKNHEVLYRAYTRLIDQGVKDLPNLVFVGMPGWGVSDFLSDLRLDPRTKGKIILLNNIDDRSLVWLYQNCWFTVFPSLYEGWGLPVVESLAAGKFCLASNAASVPEAGGNYAEYVDPWDVDAWAEKIKLYIGNPRLISEFEIMIHSGYKLTSWRDTATSVFHASDL